MNLFKVTTDRLTADDFGTVHSLLKSASTYSFSNLNTANMINSFIKASSSSSDLSRYLIVLFFIVVLIEYVF